MSKLTLLLVALAVLSALHANILTGREVTHSKCIRKMIKNHFVGQSLLVILPKFNANLADQIFKLIHRSYTLTIVDKTKKISGFHSLSKSSNILFLITGRLDLIQSITYLKLIGLWNPHANIFVILSNEMVVAKRQSFLNMKEMKKIFELFMKETSFKVNLMAFDEHHIPNTFVWFPYDDENNCSSRVQIIRSIGVCLSDRYAKKADFMIRTNYTDLPIIPRTFNDCPLHITALDAEPYIMCNRDGKLECNGGIEIRLFENVSKLLKLKLSVEIRQKIDDVMYNQILQR